MFRPAWTAVAYPSLKPLGPWFKDLVARLEFLTRWVDRGIPPSYWISGFYFPQGFLTACLQNYARKYAYPIDTVAFSFVFRDEDQMDTKPEDGVYIYGLFLEGARWDKAAKSLVDPRPKELFSPVPVIHMLPQQNRPTPQSGIYRCPVYKILTRTGTLSTTGHSTNFVTWYVHPTSSFFPPQSNPCPYPRPPRTSGWKSLQTGRPSTVPASCPRPTLKSSSVTTPTGSGLAWLSSVHSGISECELIISTVAV
jgi:Dynein heavy chain C-terminal domain